MHIQVNDLIAKGGQAEVFSCQYENKDYVVKQLKPDKQGYRWVEPYIMTRLQSPYITQGFIQLFSDGLYIYQPRARFDLKRFIRHFKAGTPELLENIFKQCVEAVAFLHSKGFIHADIKPSNFLCYITRSNTEETNRTTTDSFTVKLNDFGLSTKYEWNHHCSIGTPVYRAPEVATKSWGPSIDVWGLGHVLYELLYQNSLFQLENLTEEMRHFKMSYPEFLESDLLLRDSPYHKWLFLCKRMLNPNPKTRITLPEVCEIVNVPFQPYSRPFLADKQTRS